MAGVFPDQQVNPGCKKLWEVISKKNEITDQVRSSDIQRDLGVEPLLLCIKRKQLRRYLIRILLGASFGGTL